MTDLKRLKELAEKARDLGIGIPNYNGLKPNDVILSLLNEVERWKEISEASHTDVEYEALQIENNELRKDRERLEWMFKNPHAKPYKGRYGWHMIGRSFDEFKTPREAIDAAIQSERNGND